MFSRMLLENQIENIHHTESSEQVRAYLTLVEQLGICLRELRTLEKGSLMDEAQSMLKEMEEQMAEEARHLQTSKPATKNWSTIPGNSRSSPRMWSKS